MNTIWGVPSLKHSIHLQKSPQDWWSMSLLPCLCSYPGPCCYLISPPFWSAHIRSQDGGWVWERERGPQKLAAASRITGASSQGRWCSSLSGWLTWVGQLKETALGSPSAESAQLPRFPKLGCWDTSITASHSFRGKRNLSFLHLDKLTSNNQNNRLSSPLSQQDIVETMGSWMGRGKILSMFSLYSY